jgi:hypothetical protein
VTANTVEERFVGFLEVADTTGATLADRIWNFIVEMGLDSTKIRGQVYDGASNMSGRIRCVAARFMDSALKLCNMTIYNC